MSAAAAAWAGVGLGRAGLWVLAAGSAAVLVAAGAVRPRECGRVALPSLGIVLAAGVLSGLASVGREQAVLAAWLPEGPVEVQGTAATDLQPGSHSDWFLFRPDHMLAGGSWQGWAGPTLRIFVGSAQADIEAGRVLLVRGTARASPGRARGHPYAGVVRAREIRVLSPGTPVFDLANRVRGRIGSGLEGSSSSGALLAGFLIGDIRDLPAADREAMRRAGLSHFVAVSGSNVALFLGLWWIVTAPMARGSRRRAVVGIAGLVLFVVITRAEPSVVRAALMAGLVLAGSAYGVPFAPWTALGLAVAGSLLVAGELAGNVGFQLSVAATGGVLIGASTRTTGPAWISRPLAITLGAQAAVAPLLLWHFGTVPVAAPLTNLVAAPLVAVSTITGGLGLLAGLAPLTSLGVLVAGLVLDLAWLSAPLPQLGWTGLLVLGGGVAALRFRRLRVPVGLLGAAFLVMVLSQGSAALARPVVVFLDVGQGDAALLLGAAGETVLVDGGPDPVVLSHKLDRYGIGRLDLVVISHPHADHVAGLSVVADRLPIGVVWQSGYQPAGEHLAQLLQVLDRRGVSALVPEVGDRFRIGSIALEVLGPGRRYASPNDQSLVVRATVGSRTVLFTGDVERVAQAELGPLRADILKVPHQGAATSDPEWLVAVGSEVAVISVGPNDFGHPAPEIIEALTSSGTKVLRTDEAGDVIIPLG